IYVLKQCWRPIDAVHEGSVYPPPEDAKKHHIGRVYSYEDVTLGTPAETVTTKNFVRGNLEHQTPPTPAERNTKRKRAEDNFEAAEENEPRVIIIPETDQLVFEFKQGNFVDRVLSRTLLVDSFGWPLQQFCDLPELARVALQTVRGSSLFFLLKMTWLTLLSQPLGSWPLNGKPSNVTLALGTSLSVPLVMMTKPRVVSSTLTTQRLPMAPSPP
ncbi:hypothetical protein C0991_011935, partial [Blastosporella zonata]